MVKPLVRQNKKVISLGSREGKIVSIKILPGTPELKNINTVPLYIGPKRQPEIYSYIFPI
jgi:uncharacterized protein